MNDEKEHRSEAPAEETNGKKVRRTTKDGRAIIEPVRQPKQFGAPGTEVRK